ncbi:MAG: chaperone NapD [Deferribacterales bacterium]
MIFTGSLVTYITGRLDDAINYLKKFQQLEIHTVSEDKCGIVVTLEAENEDQLEDICQRIKNHDAIIDISHHYFNFEEEVDKIRKGEITNISLKGFSKSEQRKERDKLNEY